MTRTDRIPKYYSGSNCGDNVYNLSYEGYLLYSKGNYAEAKKEIQSYIEDTDIAISYDSDVLLAKILLEEMQ